MKFFNIDCHISVIEDVKNIFAELGHSVDSWSISGHNWVFNRQPMVPEIINSETWRSLNSHMIKSFNNKYRNLLSNYDGFICTYPPAFAQIFAEYNKPIIVQVPIRYEVPYSHDAKSWYMLNEFLSVGYRKGLVKLIANSIYDAKYFEAFTDILPTVIPSLCEYTDIEYSPDKSSFLLSSRLGLDIDGLVPVSSLGRFKWKDIGTYAGVVVIPYNASQMSIFEYYTANIPMFCPSYNFLFELMKNHPNQVMSELSWNKIFGLPAASAVRGNYGLTDPNNYANPAIMHMWAQFSDIYHMPHVIYFDSFDDLKLKLSSTNLKTVSEQMRQHNASRRSDIMNAWRGILASL